MTDLPGRVRITGCAMLLLVALALVVSGAKEAHAVIACPARDGTPINGDIDGDGTNDAVFPDWRAIGDDDTNPRCKLYCVAPKGRLALFILKCGEFIMHRCPYEGARNRTEIINGKVKGFSIESAAGGGPATGADDDRDGTVEKVEYEETVVDGKCKLTITTYHDGTKVDPPVTIDCPKKVADLPWPKQPKPKPAPTPTPTPPPPPPPPPTNTPVLPWPWMIGLVITVITLIGLHSRRNRRRPGSN